MSGERDTRFYLRDLLWLGAIIMLGGLGYQCSFRSSLIQPLLPLLGAFFSISLLALFGMCIVKVISGRCEGRIAGLLFALFPVLCAGLIWLGYRAFLLLTN